ncbi:MAG: serpin family protein [Lentisphaerae bacterium]|nr:serpin family protein [Lentisphaerota bacterium]
MKKILILITMLLLGAGVSAQVQDKYLLNIFDRAHQREAAQNVMLSPWGIQQCFSMLAPGCGENSQKEFAAVLGIDKNSLKDIQNAVRELEWNKTTFNSVNAVFYNHRYTLHKNFIDHVLKNCRGRIFYIDFARKAPALTMLNDIVQKATYGMHKDFFKSGDLEGDPALMAVNILWVNIKWDVPFELGATRKQKFAAPGKQDHQVMMMHAVRKVPYYNDGTVHAVMLSSYDTRFQIMLAMPLQEKTPLSAVTELLAQKGLQHIVEKAQSTNKTELSMPRIQLDSSNDLVELLRTMGMKVTFDPAAGDLNGIVKDKSLYIAKARQEVKLMLNESGVKVTAVTAAIPKLTSAAPTDKNNVFTADRPFVMAVFDSKTRAIMLLGAINRP